MVCLPLSANAQEFKQENDVFLQGDVSNINLNIHTSNLEKSDVYEEVTQTADSIEEYTKNNMDRQYEGEEISVNKAINEVVNEVTAFSVRSIQENTDPNYAYLVEHENTVQGTLFQASEMRWYGFVLDQTSKASIMLQSVSDVDADIYVF